MLRALVQRFGGDRDNGLRQRDDRVSRQVRIGGVTLHATGVDLARHRAAPADLDRVAERVRIRRLAEHAVREDLAAIRRPLQQLGGAVDGGAFLVAGDEEGDRAGMRHAGFLQVAKCCGDGGGDATLHVGSTAPPQFAAGDLAGERAVRPCSLVAGRHDVGMAGKAQCGRTRTDARIEVLDVGRVGIGEGHPMHLEAGVVEPALDLLQRPALVRGDGRTAHEGLGEGDGVQLVCHGGHAIRGER